MIIDGIFIAVACVWMAAANIVKSVILVGQERNRFWTKHFLRNGRTRLDAYESWKRLFNMLQCLQHLSFFMCAWRLFRMPGDSWISCVQPEYISRLIFGVMCILISQWSLQQCYEALGDYG